MATKAPNRAATGHRRQDRLRHRVDANGEKNGESGRLCRKIATAQPRHGQRDGVDVGKTGGRGEGYDRCCAGPKGERLRQHHDGREEGAKAENHGKIKRVRQLQRLGHGSFPVRPPAQQHPGKEDLNENGGPKRRQKPARERHIEGTRHGQHPQCHHGARRSVMVALLALDRSVRQRHHFSGQVFPRRRSSVTPVISTGFGSPIRSRSVGATFSRAAQRPSFTPPPFTSSTGTGLVV